MRLNLAVVVHAAAAFGAIELFCVVDDQVVPLRLDGEITISDLRFEEALA